MQIKQKILSAVSLVVILIDGIVMRGIFLICSAVCVARGISLISSLNNLKPTLYAEKVNV